MVECLRVKPLPVSYLESIGFPWHTDQDNTPYIADELVLVSREEAQAYYNAANELYDMYIEAAEYVIKHDLFHEIGIPFNLIEPIKISWDNDTHWHLYGRFDLAGGIDGKPIKLLEFNADTPTAVFETAIIQWAILKYNQMNETKQFNGLYEALLDNFKRIDTFSRSTDDCAELYKNRRFLFSSIAGSVEEEQTVRLLEYIARQAGYKTAFCYAHDVEFSEEDGIFCHEQKYELWFKLIPWEDIAIEESQLALILNKILQNNQAAIFNPAYTLLFQSKALMAILWKLFPNHPLLLETSFEPLSTKQVQKPVFGREGISVSILDKNGHAIYENKGMYDNVKPIYQAYTELPKDKERHVYQAGVFYAYEACALGYRRGNEIIDDSSKFVGHILR